MRRLALALMVTVGLPVAAAAATRLLIVTGLPGEPVYAELFEQRARTLVDSAQQHLGIARERIIWLASHATDADGVDGEASRESVLRAIDSLAARSDEGDSILILLIGHGTARDDRVLFNLPGPDLAPADLLAPLAALDGRRVALVNTAPASAPFTAVLAAPGRVLISATGSGAEDRHTLFADPFVAAFASDAADADKDGRVSLLEAFNYASHEVARRYEGGGRLRTEHALLEDDGDGRGSAQPGSDGADGTLARSFYLAEPTTQVAARAPHAIIIEAEARDLLADIGALRATRVAMPADEFERRLETLLVRLAINRRALRAELAP